jgi:predicted nucleotidyltransferase
MPVAEPPGDVGASGKRPAGERVEHEQLAHAVVGVLRSVLGDALVGAYLHGSAVLGGLRPTSDLDVLALVDRPTTGEERSAIVRELLQISGRNATRGPARPVELTLVQHSQLRPWHPAPIVELVYGEWLRVPLERGEIPEPAPMSDLAPEVTLVLAGNRALFGPPPAELIDPVPQRDLRRAVTAGIPRLVADLESDQRNVLLTLARILATLETDEIMAKDDAAELVAHRLTPGSRDLLLAARQMYLEGVTDEAAGPAWAETKTTARDAATELISEIAGFETD